ncbi:MAG: response regulator [Oleispira sp.]
MTIRNALIVDDSKSARIMLQRLLEKMDVIALGVESAEEALSYLENQQPDIIFMDHMMPGMDGLECTQTIKSNPKTQGIPTIMYTSKEGDGYNSLARSHGANGVLPKPANQQAIMAVINSLESTAANDVADTHANVSDTHQISIDAIEKMIQLRLNTSVLSAKAEIAAGLDGVSHQLLQTQQERLTIAERSLKQHIKPLQTQLFELADDNSLFKRIQPQLQKQIMVIADKVSRKKVDILAKENASKIQQLEEQQNNLLVEIANQSQTAMLRGLIGGALLGAAMAIAAGFII